MSSTVLAVALFSALGQTYGYPTDGTPLVSPTNGIEQLHPFDAYEPWVHGHFQDIPAYGGYHLFRPYNYKHVLSQTQVAAGWGMSPTLAYTQEYFRRREQATMEQRMAPPATNVPHYEMPALRPAPNRARSAQREYVPEEYPARRTSSYNRPPVMELAPPRTVDSAYYVSDRDARLERMQERIQQQSYELQAMQEALEDEYRAPTALPARR